MAVIFKPTDHRWVGSEEGIVLKTVMVSSSNAATTTTENGKTMVKAGTLITDSVLGKGFLWNDADVTDGAVLKSIMIRGNYVDAYLPASVSASATELATQGLYAVAYPETEIAYGEVTE